MHFVLWVGDAVLKLTVVGEQDQSFAVSVQPACGVYIFLIDEVGECLASLFIGELAEYVEWFIEQDYQRF